MGNLFVFTAAGFDTTANTMGYAMTLLAVYPEWQGWIVEEIDEVLADQAEGTEGELEYNEIFPRLVRVLAVMVRHLLCPVFPHLPRSQLCVSFQADVLCSTKRCASTPQ